MPLPESVLTISSIALVGFAMTESKFPRLRVRRLDPSFDATSASEFYKRAASHLDFSVDLTSRLELTETVVGAYAWSSAPTDLIVTWVRYVTKGVLAFVSGGTDGQTYELVIHAKTSNGRAFQYLASIEVNRDANETMPAYLPPLLLDADDPDRTFLVDLFDVPVSPPFNNLTGEWL